MSRCLLSDRMVLLFAKSVCTFLCWKHFCNCPLRAPPPGYGSVIQMYPGGDPVRAGVDSFGFPAHFRDTLHGFPICHVNALLAGTLDTTAKDPSTGREISVSGRLVASSFID